MAKCNQLIPLPFNGLIISPYHQIANATSYPTKRHTELAFCLQHCNIFAVLGNYFSEIGHVGKYS